MDRSPTRHRSFRHVISRFLMILLGILFALVLAEVALRAFSFSNRFVLLERLEQQWESDDELLLHLKPNLDLDIIGHPDFSYTVKTNADGLRDEPFEGTFDIAAIGDSFTFGYGVEQEESWPTRLEAISGARVANLGYAGWNSLLYPVTIRRYAIPLQSRIWLWAFVSNDLVESVNAETFLASGEEDYKEWAEANRMLVTHLPFPYNLRTVQMLTALIRPELFQMTNSDGQVFDNGEIRFRFGADTNMIDLSSPEVRRGWQLSEAALLEAQELAARHDASLVVIYVPSREHVYWPYIKDMMPDVYIQQLEELEARLSGFCKAHDIHYLSLLPGLQSRALEGVMLYFPSDGHWNPSGQEMAAQLIYDLLLQERLLLPLEQLE